MDLLGYFPNTSSYESRWAILCGTIQFVPTFTLTPRLILSLRELYARDLRGRCGGEIDTAFGLTSTCGHSAAASVVMFANGERQDDVLEHGEEIEMEGREIQGSGSGLGV